MKFKTNLLRPILRMLFISLLFFSCSPEDGNDGIDGIDGIDGADGADGADGETGTANVIYSDWIASGFPDTINSNFDQWEMYAPELTQEIHDTGVILVYARVSNLIYSIPTSFFGTTQEQWSFRLFDFNDTLIAIRVQSIDDSNIGTPFLNGDFRYVIIPGGTSASSRPANGSSQVDYSSMSYEEIKSLFNIPD
ncbi:hypothetical protein [Winogradskyella psychrotolerans]|uniref:hypothetical protein n=1 Tax=Winogradskyella psychrotolerans TaxID=1344585 RepID=UPI001C0767CE|nr:hypothetical protein [Winogradskyella psychrotolerans]MBU2926699.1 hypothetical protein [Winogradskyella psychrotolerans]